jgi:hypothetical protein
LRAIAGVGVGWHAQNGGSRLGGVDHRDIAVRELLELIARQNAYVEGVALRGGAPTDALDD